MVGKGCVSWRPVWRTRACEDWWCWIVMGHRTLRREERTRMMISLKVWWQRVRDSEGILNEGIRVKLWEVVWGVRDG